MSDYRAMTAIGADITSRAVTQDAKSEPRTMGTVEAQEKGMQLVPKWAPAASVGLTLVGLLAMMVINWTQNGSSIAQLQFDVKELAASIDKINTQRESRHDDYNRELIATRSAEAHLQSVMELTRAQCDRIEYLLLNPKSARGSQ